jgi:hypothetical protein
LVKAKEDSKNWFFVEEEFFEGSRGLGNIRDVSTQQSFESE